MFSRWSREKGKGLEFNSSPDNEYGGAARPRGPNRRFPSGQLYARTIIGVWDPGVPLSVFSAPLDSGTPHCNLSELQFALLCSLDCSCGRHRTYTDFFVTACARATDASRLFRTDFRFPRFRRSFRRRVVPLFFPSSPPIFLRAIFFSLKEQRARVSARTNHA